MIIDTHAHLGYQDNSNVEREINDAINVGVEGIVNIGCSIKDAKVSLEISSKYDNVYSAVGLYPYDNNEESSTPLKERLKIIEELGKNNKVVAIGECGLDFTTPAPWEIPRPLKDQIKLFENQIDISKKLNKPIIIHSRNAKDVTIDVLNNNYKKLSSKINGVWHCFTEDIIAAQNAIDLGLFISVGGIITYPSATNIQDTIKNIPLQYLVLETDTPYLVPQNFRKKGIKNNQPKYIVETAEFLAKLKNIPYEEVCNITTQNAKKLYKI